MLSHLGLLTVLSAITIYLPDEVASFTRCPERGTTDLPAIISHADEKFCNVYHKCNCSRTECHVVESHVCPLAKVYSKEKGACLGRVTSTPAHTRHRSSPSLDIEQAGCETTYVQWVQTHSSSLDQGAEPVAIMVSDSLLPTSSSKDFECEQGQPGKFRYIPSRSFVYEFFFVYHSDPNICNIFHVCITRNDKTVDQPFMCPFPTVFKTGASGKMFCARAEPADCQGKAFYRTMEEPEAMDAGNDDSVNYRLPENTLMIDRCTKAGLYADSLYCNAYHKCGSQGQDEQYLCENQLLFNPESNICDYPINVVCGGRTRRR